MLCERVGAQLRVIPLNADGTLQLEQLDLLLDDRTRLVAVTQVSNVLGTENPVAEIVEKAHQAGAKVLIDGAQAVMHHALDVQALDCDFYVFSGHKLYGPTGIGVLYVKEEILQPMPPWEGGGSMIATVSLTEGTTYARAPWRFEAGTPNTGGHYRPGGGGVLRFRNRPGRHPGVRTAADALRAAGACQRAGSYPVWPGRPPWRDCV